MSNISHLDTIYSKLCMFISNDIIDNKCRNNTVSQYHLRVMTQNGRKLNGTNLIHGDTSNVVGIGAEVAPSISVTTSMSSPLKERM
jgi:hypothetical protein